VSNPGDPFPSPPPEIGSVDTALAPTFEAAFTAGRLLGFEYINTSGRATRRAVEPHGLLVRAPLWLSDRLGPRS
jgi:predicted DNA-binding transcriptional regulator YafY